jgi:hypothetical protein
MSRKDSHRDVTRYELNCPPAFVSREGDKDEDEQEDLLMLSQHPTFFGGG